MCEDCYRHAVHATGFAEDFAERVTDSKERLSVELSPMEAWALMTAMQLAMRHPAVLRSPTMQEARTAARRLQELVAMTPALRAIANMGW